MCALNLWIWDLGFKEFCRWKFCYLGLLSDDLETGIDKPLKHVCEDFLVHFCDGFGKCVHP